MAWTGRQKTEYQCWADIKHRCLNPKAIAFDRSGGRGIKVCKRWRDSFYAFLEDIGTRPTAKHSIDRIDNDANYSCGHCDECLENGWTANCRWSTYLEQNRNRRTNRVIEIDGVRLCVVEWAERLAIPERRIRSRLERGWTDREAVLGREDA